ncbi:DUF3263 domain-containing protein [Cryptosporangium aurantiacum]|uniref:DUF3263 domain-containing protein n=1 Tax=Cryptosporangium aurantiacum TaxID=134849 RepID=A0A1M7N2R5_9ACTN|nr:DUF3263 domain-containing protein [Cryptosporangium aurantiacum]SHM97851.1 Protein of unknown function [Cryptosporangium aurantiacum]
MDHSHVPAPLDDIVEYAGPEHGDDREGAPDADLAVAPEQDESGLTDRERAILEFERQWWQYAGAKEQAIREQFSMSATRYYQLLNALIDRHEALVHDPMLVKRLRRVRAARQRQRSARRLGVRL